MPELCTEYTSYYDKLQEWEHGFLKPQFGALGTNVNRVSQFDTLPKFLEGVVPEQMEKAILQRAIPPPRGWAGMSVRHLIQRDINRSWISRPAVLRRSKIDAVVNVARGAEVVLAKENLPDHTIKLIEEYSQAVGIHLQSTPNGNQAVEFGIDYVIDIHYNPWLIEVNSRPRGRLEALSKKYPERFSTLHQEACMQPILYLASICSKNNSAVM